MKARSGKHVVIVGLGNIGAALARLIARLPSVERITLIDRDVYEAHNLAGQDVCPRDVGKPKVSVVGQRLRQIDCNLSIKPLMQPVEDVPRGLLRSDVILSALDSRQARQAVCEAAWRMGVPVVDAGVEARDALARVSVYVPSVESPCIECSWGEDDYANLEQNYWCSDAGVPPSTNAPAYLGALAASLQAAECDKLLNGRCAQSLGGQEVVVSAEFSSHQVTSLRRNRGCRFDHSVWARVEELRESPGQISLRQTFELADAWVSAEETELRVPGYRFATARRCPRCGVVDKLLYLGSRLRPAECGSCGEPLIVMGFYTRDALAAVVASGRNGRRSLRSIGLRPGDIFTVTRGQHQNHYQLGGVR